MSDRRLPGGRPAGTSAAGFAVAADRRLRLRRSVLILLAGDGGLRAWLRRGEKVEALGRLAEGAPETRTGEGLAGLLRRLAGSRRRRSVTVVLRLSANAGLVREDLLPRRAARNLGRILAHRIDLLTPWPADEAIFTCWNLRRREGGRIAVTVAVARKAQVDAALTALARFDLRPDIVDFVVDAPTAPPRFDLLLPPPESRLPAIMRGAAVAALALLLLAGVRLGFELAAVESRINAGQIRLELLRRELAARTPVQPEADAPGTEAELVRELGAERASPLRLVDAMSRLLPDEVWLESLRMEGRKVEIRGVARDTAALARLFEASPDFSGLRFTAPAVRVEDAGGEGGPMVRFGLGVEAGGGLLLDAATAVETAR